MTVPLIAFIMVTDTSFVPNTPMSQVLLEGFGFAMLAVMFFVFPVALIAAAIAKLYSVTVLKQFNLPMPTLLLIGGLLGSLATGIWSIVATIAFLPLGFFGGVLAGLLMFRFQTGRWA